MRLNEGDIVKDIMKQVILIAIAAAIGFFANEYKTNRDNCMRYLDYHLVATPDVFNRFSSPAPQITIKAGNQEVTKVTQLEVVFQNPGGRDFENVPVYIDLSAKEGDDMEILGKSIVGDGGLLEGVEDVSLRDVKIDPKTIRCSFSIRSANRGKAWGERPRATFLIRGDSAPTVVVKTSKKGLEIRPYDANNYRSVSPITALFVAYIITVLIVYVVWRTYRMRRHLGFVRKHVSLVTQCLLANRNRVEDNSQDALHLLSLELYLSNASDKTRDVIRSTAEYLKENTGAIKDCTETGARDMAKTLVMREHKVYLQRRSWLNKFLYPLPEVRWEQLD